MLAPISRDSMRGLKEKKDEELRIEKINRCVQIIYGQAIRVAETSVATSYSLNIDSQGISKRPLLAGFTLDGTEYQFYKDNMTEILVNLWSLFPECTIKFAKMCTGNDGKRYDISTIDKKMLPFINQKQTDECIVVDWS